MGLKGKLSNYIDDLDQLVSKKNWDILFTDQDIKNNDGIYVPCSGHAKRPDFIPANPDQYYNDLLFHLQFY